MNLLKAINQRQLCILLPIILSSPLSYADDLDDLVKTLVSIRGEVEELQTQLDSAKQAHRMRLESLNTQFTDLNVENQRQTVALEKLQQAITKQQEAIQLQKSSEISLGPTLLDAIQGLESTVNNSLPFKTDERLQALAELKQQINANTLDGKKAANRLWAFIEDEIRLSRENGIYSQTISLNGAKRLVDVAKLGSVLMYFKTDDQHVGKAVKKGDNWQFIELMGEQDKEKIALLFDSLQKQIRQGYFELPNPAGS